MDDIIEFVIDVVTDVLADTAFCRAVRRKHSPFGRFLMGLGAAAVVGLAIWCIVTLVH